MTEGSCRHRREDGTLPVRGPVLSLSWRACCPVPFAVQYPTVGDGRTCQHLLCWPPGPPRTDSSAIENRQVPSRTPALAQALGPLALPRQTPDVL